tara:strand:+ start:1088 stop:2395 length:1308 start_codon:yes stop_codon:yes gene_type:complete
MAYETYNVLGALNRMLESKERREATRAQSALQMLQFAQQKKIADFQMAGQKLEFLTEVNNQVMLSQSSNILSTTGLSSLYLRHKDDPQAAAKELTRSQSTRNPLGMKMDKDDAAVLVSNIFAHYANDPKGMLGIAQDLKEAVDRYGIKKETQDDLKLIETYRKLGYLEFGEGNKITSDSYKQLSDVSKVLNTSEELIEEMYEYGKTGDTVIQRLKGVGAPEVNETDLKTAMEEIFSELKSSAPDTDEEDIDKSLDATASKVVSDVALKHKTNEDIKKVLSTIPNKKLKSTINMELESLNSQIANMSDELTISNELVKDNELKLKSYEDQITANEQIMDILDAPKYSGWIVPGPSSKYPERKSQWNELANDNNRLRREMKPFEKEKDALNWLQGIGENAFYHGSTSSQYKDTDAFNMLDKKRKLNKLYRERDNLGG